MNYERFSFYIEKLANGAWIIGTLKGQTDDYGRTQPDRAGFEQYAEAEKHAVGELKRMMREYRNPPKKA